MRNVFVSYSHRLDQSDADDFRRKFGDSTQKLDEDYGDEKTALSSIHALFPITREILKAKGRLAPNFTKIAVIVLNQILRPFLSKWHRRCLAGEFENPESCIEFRKELENIRIQLLCYSRMLAEIAKVEDLTNLCETNSEL